MRRVMTSSAQPARQGGPDWSAATIMRGPYALGDTRAARAYCRGVLVAAALAGVIVLIAAGQSLERVHAVLVAEQLMAAPHG